MMSWFFESFSSNKLSDRKDSSYTFSFFFFFNFLCYFIFIYVHVHFVPVFKYDWYFCPLRGLIQQDILRGAPHWHNGLTLDAEQAER